ncbi:MAG: Clp protease N-terminal domain-containing protein [Cyanobacteriota bacterium]|nr:Clp protease N-terminal domain-containing protein [Cyanobacteriota bacterium]
MQVIQLGRAAARELHWDVVGTEAMLLGLLAEGTSAAFRVLTTAGLTFESVRQHIVPLLGSRPVPPVGPVPSSLPFAPRAKRVLELAREQGEQLRQSRVAPEHLLLGILKEDKETPAQYTGVAVYVLREKCNLDLAHLEQQLREVIQRFSRE